MRQHGISKETVKHFLVDAGAVYLNYGLEGERKLGATRGGNSFSLENEFKEIEMDGAKGAIKGAKRVITVTARVTANLLEMTAENFKQAIAGSDMAAHPDETAATHQSITRSREIAESDYIENVALVGNISGTATPVIFIIENALADGNLELATADKDEGALEVQFTAHFDPAKLEEGDDTEPWEIRYPTIA